MPRPRVRNAETKACDLLARQGIDTPPVAVDEVAASLGVAVRKQPLEENVSAVLVLKPGGTPVIGVNAHHHANRQRFSIAHELGHFVLHGETSELFVDEFMVRFRDAKSSLAIDPKEIEANTFAASLLMPEHMLRADLTKREFSALDEAAVRSLALRYGVSEQALTFRLVNLELLEGFGS
jgi:Zn-dependent peptidase ImmA (M78 family)